MWSNQINSQIRQILRIRKIPYAICLVERCLLTSMNFNFIARAQLLVLISAVSKDDIMISCQQRAAGNNSEVIGPGPCWYCVDVLPSIDPPSNAFKQSTRASAPFVDQDLLIIQGVVDFFVCWVLGLFAYPFLGVCLDLCLCIPPLVRHPCSNDLTIKTAHAPLSVHVIMSSARENNFQTFLSATLETFYVLGPGIIYLSMKGRCQCWCLLLCRNSLVDVLSDSPPLVDFIHKLK